MKTYTAKKGEIERQWVVIDAQDQVLGRLVHVSLTSSGGKTNRFSPTMWIRVIS